MAPRFALLVVATYLWSSHLCFQPGAGLALPSSDLGPTYKHRIHEENTTPITKRDDVAKDPNDHSWITHWAALGDSYSAGIGCGYLLDHACSRYNLSWPNLMNEDARMGKTSREFQFLACSGATSPEILAHQIPQLSDGLQIITMTAGGNDAGFSDILIDCVFGVSLESKCDTLLYNAQALMQSEAFKSNIESLLSAAISKLGENGRVYYAGYAPFFDITSTQCNDVSWDVFNMGFIHTKLTTDLRTRINVLVSQMNAILEGIVRAAGDQAVFVDYSGWVEKVEGRFCEDGIEEPYGNNEDLFFYEWSTIDKWETPDFQSEHPRRSLEDYGNSTFPGKMVSAIDSAMAKNSTLQVRNIYADDTELLGELGVDPDDLSDQTALLMDGMKRVFHPTFSGHSLIANLMFYHMGAERAKMFDQQVKPIVGDILPSSCMREPGYVDGGPIVPSVTCVPAPDVPDDYWFDTDSIRQIQDSFCRYVGNRNQTDISRSDSEDNGLGQSFSYQIYGLFNTYIDVWVQNAGCRRPTLYSSERTCRALIGAVVNQCKLWRENSQKTRLANTFQVPQSLPRSSAGRRRLAVKSFTSKLEADSQSSPKQYRAGIARLSTRHS